MCSSDLQRVGSLEKTLMLGGIGGENEKREEIFAKTKVIKNSIEKIDLIVNYMESSSANN